MKTFFLFFHCLLSIGFCNVYADEVIWKGHIQSDGSATVPIPLVLNEHYRIKVSQVINLGKWVQERENLANDACYEFNKEKHLEKYESLKNSQNISVCDGTYHLDHVYQSAPFVAKQNRLLFWVSDTDYDDNNGAFYVEIIHKKESKESKL
jgi:hypothetical protein